MCEVLKGDVSELVKELDLSSTGVYAPRGFESRHPYRLHPLIPFHYSCKIDLKSKINEMMVEMQVAHEKPQPSSIT